MTEDNSKTNNKNTTSKDDNLTEQLTNEVRDQLRKIAREKTEAINRNAMLCGIMHQVNKDRKGETPRYDFTPTFMDFLSITGGVLNRRPDLVEFYKGDGSVDADFSAVTSIISRYLAYNRIMDRKTTGLKEWEKRTSSIVIDQQEITDEERLMIAAHQGEELGYYDELYDLTHLTHRMLGYKYNRDRIIPFIMEMAKK